MFSDIKDVAAKHFAEIRKVSYVLQLNLGLQIKKSVYSFSFFQGCTVSDKTSEKIVDLLPAKGESRLYSCSCTFFLHKMKIFNVELMHHLPLYHLQNEKLEEVLVKMKQEIQQMTKWVHTYTYRECWWISIFDFNFIFKPFAPKGNWMNRLSTSLSWRTVFSNRGKNTLKILTF